MFEFYIHYWLCWCLSKWPLLCERWAKAINRYTLCTTACHKKPQYGWSKEAIIQSVCLFEVLSSLRNSASDEQTIVPLYVDSSISKTCIKRRSTNKNYPVISPITFCYSKRHKYLLHCWLRVREVVECRWKTTYYNPYLLSSAGDTAWTASNHKAGL